MYMDSDYEDDFQNDYDYNYVDDTSDANSVNNGGSGLPSKWHELDVYSFGH